jgi:hypothetical protein
VIVENQFHIAGLDSDPEVGTVGEVIRQDVLPWRIDHGPACGYRDGRGRLACAASHQGKDGCDGEERFLPIDGVFDSSWFVLSFDISQSNRVVPEAADISSLG